MKKYILGLTTAALLCSPFAYADDTTGQMTTPTTTDSMPSTPTTTTPPPTTSTTTATTNSGIELKTSDGKIIHAQIDTQDLQGVNVGDKLEVTNLGTDNSSTTSPGASNATPTDQTTNTNSGNTTNMGQ